jgi:hypothetical protein
VYLGVLLAGVLFTAGCGGAGQAAATIAPTANLPAGQAQAAVQAFARGVLGREVGSVHASGLSADLGLPSTVRLEVELMLDWVAELYIGLLSDGMAVVGTGQGAFSGDVEVNIRWSSMGVYSLQSRVGMPSDAEAALALLQQTFPALAGLSYTPGRVPQGYAFRAQSSEPAVDPRSGQASLTAQSVLLGVWTQPSGKTGVYAVVGRGDFALGTGQ